MDFLKKIKYIFLKWQKNDRPDWVCHFHPIFLIIGVREHQRGKYLRKRRSQRIRQR
jgi:hypothetical protein